MAAAGAPFAVTSNVGGSARIPSLYCGLFGEKPAEGTIPISGTLPHVPPGSLVSIYCQLGRPTTRHACDLYPRVTRLPAVGLALVETLDSCLDRLI
jgi:hypothetical protein